MPDVGGKAQVFRRTDSNELHLFSFDERICSRIYDKPGKDEAES